MKFTSRHTDSNSPYTILIQTNCPKGDLNMHQIRTYEDQFLIYELVEESTQSWVKVAPERGGIIIGYGTNGQELLYLDKATFYDTNANIRGGNPILFPICGQLTNKQYEWTGKINTMANHGFARNLPWEVIRMSDQGEASITIKLVSNAATRESYPFDWEMEYTYRLLNGVLTIDQVYRNLSNEIMPFYAGFHPYFKADRKNIAYDTDATQYLDYNDHLMKSFSGSLDLEGMVESAAFLNASTREISFEPVQGVKVHLTYGNEFKYVVLWSIEGKDFVCVEPWMALNGEFQRKAELYKLAPGETLTTSFAFHCES